MWDMVPAVLSYSYPHWETVLLMEEGLWCFRSKELLQKLDYWSLWRWEGLSLVLESARLGMH